MTWTETTIATTVEHLSGVSVQGTHLPRS